jgi:hypothetical protein
MNCPLCEAPLFENIGESCAKYDGVWYHASCLYEEMPELDPNREPPEPDGEDICRDYQAEFRDSQLAAQRMK